jgi:hypothetical protein
MTTPSTESLPIPGKEPTFRHADDPDVTWQKVRRQQNADGSEGTVVEKWFAFSPDPQYLSLLAMYSPGMIVRRHGHYSPHVIYIMEGLRPHRGRRRRSDHVRGHAGRSPVMG